MSFSFKTLYEHWNIWSATFDRKTNCHNHVSNLCKKLSAKCHGHFNFPTWLLSADMDGSQQVDSLHEWPIRLIYNDLNSPFHQLLEKDNSQTIHQANLQTLSIEMFEVNKNIALQIIKSLIKIKKSSI